MLKYAVLLQHFDCCHVLSSDLCALWLFVRDIFDLVHNHVVLMYLSVTIDFSKIFLVFSSLQIDVSYMFKLC